MATLTTTPEKLMQLNYEYAVDLQQLFNSIQQIAMNADVSSENVQISSLARIGAGLINPFLFDQLEEFIKDTQNGK